MKLEYQEIHHQYVTRLIILAVFMFKGTRRQEKVYETVVRSFLMKRLHYELNISLSVGPKMTKDENRDLAIDSILNNDELEVLNLVQVQFTTGFKEVNMQIDLNQEEKYELIIYS